MQQTSEVPEGWAKTPLVTCVDILDNQRIPVNSKEREKRFGDIPYYGATGQVGWINDYLFDEELLLIGEDGAPFFDKTKQIAYVIQGKSWVNNHAHVIRAIKELTSNKFLKYYLNFFDYNGYVTGTTRYKLNQGSMKKIPIILPPLAEQHRIVTAIEALFARLDAAEARLERVPGIVHQFRQAIYWGLLTDFENSKKYVIKDVIVGTPQNGLYKPSSKYGAGTPIIRIDSFYEGKITDQIILKRLDCSESEINKFQLYDGDILINRVNSLDFLGKCALIENIEENTVFESNMMRITPNTNIINQKYLNHVLCSPFIKNQILKKAKNAVNQSSINQKDVTSLVIYCRPLPEQHEIARRVDALFSLADQIEANVAAAKDRTAKLCQSILAQAFSGQLVPTEAELARREGREYEDANTLLMRIKAEK
ncbi:restriction endonuclease subunit S [Methanogenium sp. S4BF]|uniref:restriction endonuclease subunit S n=1 Tax=Methanogenium sp. S4BF TaxID=1789226 RepID=UPI00241630BC|nr:restriction endonuclease subunit S [Methanogenium sp. S4BF]WFN35237.1 restriction endonuclease subunit S [Methanogenium sp. S4BF]